MLAMSTAKNSKSEGAVRGPSNNVADVDAAFEALVQVAVFTIAHPSTNQPILRTNTEPIVSEPSASASALRHPSPQQPTEACNTRDTREKTAAILKGLALASPKWSMIVCQEVVRALESHFKDLNMCTRSSTGGEGEAHQHIAARLSFHDAVPSLLSCLQSKETNPFSNGCMLATTVQHHNGGSIYNQDSSEDFSADGSGGGHLQIAASGALHLTHAAEAAYPLLKFALTKLRRAADRQRLRIHIP